MSVVIVGGNECMECHYRKLCEKYNHRTKIYTKMNGTLKNRIGEPDLLVLFTGTMSHKMIRCVLSEVKEQNAVIERSHSSSVEALKNILNRYAERVGV